MRVFFLPVFYNVLILFTSDFFIVVSTLEEVRPWKMDIFFFPDDFYYGPCRA